ncbi:MAG: hypothetical protein D6823_03905 [Chloroflexi bacterium]|jgi:O-antigen/teichoic acid export membrane protein|nr:MAG: hypothetical protein D6823_03905 [Chloroflexota bacterium]
MFGTFINILLNYLLIPIFDIVGAATATLISNFTVFFLNVTIGQNITISPTNE